MLSDNTFPVLQGDYRIKRVIQRLPYGACYLAETLQGSQKRWAVREINLSPEEIGGPGSSLNTFETLARKYMLLKHPALIPLENFFYERDNEYIIFEYVPGHRLGEILELRKAPFTEYQVIDMAGKIAGALDYMHSRKVCFNDLTPSSVIITPEGDLRLTDYGLGKILLKREPEMPLWGSPGYAPPEQYGDRAVVEPSGDVYALGIMMHHLLTFWDPALSLNVIPSVRKINSEISSELEELIKKAINPDRSKRFSKAGDFLKALRRTATLKAVKSDNDNVQGESWLGRLVREIARPFIK